MKVIGRDESTGELVNREIEIPEHDYKREHSILYPYCPPGHYVVESKWQEALEEALRTLACLASFPPAVGSTVNS